MGFTLTSSLSETLIDTSITQVSLEFTSTGLDFTPQVLLLLLRPALTGSRSVPFTVSLHPLECFLPRSIKRSTFSASSAYPSLPL